MSITERDLVRIASAILECCGAPDRKLIAQLAVISWLDTVAPEDRQRAFDEFVAQRRWWAKLE